MCSLAILRACRDRANWLLEMNEKSLGYATPSPKPEISYFVG